MIEAQIKAPDRRHLSPPAKVLVVDDEPDFVRILKIKLERYGFEVYTASDGVEAMYQAFAIHPDLIILDILMPRMDGTEVSARLIQNASTKNIPILFLSGLQKKEDDLRCEAQHGPRYILAKPFVMPLLLSRIRELIDRPSA